MDINSIIISSLYVTAVIVTCYNALSGISIAVSLEKARPQCNPGDDL